MLGASTRRQSESEQQGGDESKLFSSNIFSLASFFSLIYNAKLCQGQCVVNVNYHRLTQFPAWCCAFRLEVSFFLRARLYNLIFFSFAAANEIERRHCLVRRGSSRMTQKQTDRAVYLPGCNGCIEVVSLLRGLCDFDLMMITIYFDHKWSKGSLQQRGSTIKDFTVPTDGP